MRHAVSLVLFLLATTGIAQASPIGQRLDEFTLHDTHGHEKPFNEVAGKQLTVVIFLGVECPLAKLYAPRLAAMASEFEADGVRFVGIDSNRQDLATEIAAYAAQHGIPFPLLVDGGNQIADRFGATRTPEVFVLDHERVVRYHGRIDDQHRPGAQGVRARQHDLRDALMELLAGKPVSVPETTVTGCLIGRTTPVVEPPHDAAVTWSKQISHIFQERCQDCHRPGQIGPFSLLNFADVQGWEPMIAEVIGQERMPPWHANPAYGHFANDMRLSTSDRELIQAWIRGGAPAGDPAEAPPPMHFSSDWRIGPIDDVFYMRDEPFVVPAEDKLEYQYFVVDPGYREDHWVKAVECRPGDRTVVHHINVFVLLPEIGDDFTREELTNNLLWAYSPGFRGVKLSPGMARRVPAGSKYVFQMHYSPSGRVTKDRSALGLVYADPAEVTHALEIGLAVNNAFEIPPYAANQRVVSWYDVTQDSMLIALHPHMHLRGKDFRFEALYPDGRTEILLDIPRFDFNWQYDYRLADAKSLPRGTKICCTAHFDNSPDNPVNPDPLAVVHWGDQTWQEMMIGYLHLAHPRDATAASGTPTASTPLASTHVLLQFFIAALVIGVVLATFRWRRAWLKPRAAKTQSTGEALLS